MVPIDRQVGNIRIARADAKAQEDAKAIGELVGVDPSVLKVKAQDKFVERVRRSEALADFLKDLRRALESGDGGETPEGPSADFLTDDQRRSLIDAGYDSDEAVAEASEEELRGVEGIGTATAKKLKA